MWELIVVVFKVGFCVIVLDGIGEIVSTLKDIRIELRRLNRD